MCLTFRAFNRWLLDDWGFDHDGRIFTAPYLTLADVDWAVEELEWALDQGARLIVMRAAAPTTATGRRTPVRPDVRPVLGPRERGRHHRRGARRRQRPSSQRLRRRRVRRHLQGRRLAPTLKNFAIEQAVHDYLLSMVLANLFARFPNLRVASVENGAEFLPDLFRKLRSHGQEDARATSRDDPVEIFRRHVWINPFWEDDLDDGRRADGRRPGDLRLRLAPHRGAARSRSTTSRRPRRLDRDDRRSCSTTTRSSWRRCDRAESIRNRSGIEKPAPSPVLTLLFMKTMTCKQMGGPCDLAFEGKSANDVIKAQDQHLKEVVAAGDDAHATALKEMQARWKNPLKGMGWYRQTKKDFAALPAD